MFLHFEPGVIHISGDSSVVVYLFVVMPKVKVSQKTKLQLYQWEFEGEMITTDNRILYCEACENRFQVPQHLNTNIHKENIKI
jgi:hypothetical protein